jgi:hypothetical protein
MQKRIHWRAARQRKRILKAGLSTEEGRIYVFCIKSQIGCQLSMGVFFKGLETAKLEGIQNAGLGPGPRNATSIVKANFKITARILLYS